MENDLTDEVKELNKRISDLEKMLSALMKLLTDIRKTTKSYMRLAGLLLDHGDLPPDLVLKDMTIENDFYHYL